MSNSKIIIYFNDKKFEFKNWGEVDEYQKSQGWNTENDDDLENNLSNITGNPALFYENGDKEYWVKGHLHNLKGPAMDYESVKNYYIVGIRFDEEEYKNIIKRLKLYLIKNRKQIQKEEKTGCSFEIIYNYMKNYMKKKRSNNLNDNNK